MTDQLDQILMEVADHVRKRFAIDVLEHLDLRPRLIFFGEEIEWLDPQQVNSTREEIISKAVENAVRKSPVIIGLTVSSWQGSDHETKPSDDPLRQDTLTILVATLGMTRCASIPVLGRESTPELGELLGPGDASGPLPEGLQRAILIGQLGRAAITA